jgi:hypothetical protein
MNTATLSGSLRDGVRDPVNQNKNIFHPHLLPKENAKSLYDRQDRRMGAIGLAPPGRPYTQPVELSLFSQMGSGKSMKKNLSLKQKMRPSQYAGAMLRPRRRHRVGARKMHVGGFLGKIFSGIKKAVQTVAPIVQAVKPISRFGSMIGLPSPVVELGKQVGVGRRRRRRRVGMAKRRVGGMARLAVVRPLTMGPLTMGARRKRRVGARKRRVGGARAGQKKLIRLF